MRLAWVLGVCLLPASAVAQQIGHVELLHAFRAAPARPVGGQARAADGSFYRLTDRLLYRLATDGTLTVVHTFDASSAGSGVVRSTNAVPIVVERTMWWPGPSLTPSYWYEAHNSPGATTTATRWLVAGGDLGGASGAQTYVLVANPSTTAGRARVSVLEDTGSRVLRDIDLPAKSRTNVEIPAGFASTFGVLVESLGADPIGIVVERATYGSPGGVTWAAGGNALASPLP
jgi:hypothetical protein